VLQKCIETANSYYKQVLINSIVNDTSLFICDQYANYVLQYIITLNNHIINKTITNFFIHNIAFLGKQKFASNVIEKVFDHSDDQIKELLVKKLADRELIAVLLFDMFGNYVIQKKALSVSKDPYYSFFISNIIPHFDQLKFLPFGSRLCQRLVNSYPEFAFLLNQRSFNMNMNNNMMNSKQSNMMNNNMNMMNSPNMNMMNSPNMNNMNIMGNQGMKNVNYMNSPGMNMKPINMMNNNFNNQSNMGMMNSPNKMNNNQNFNNQMFNQQIKGQMNNNANINTSQFNPKQGEEQKKMSYFAN